MKKFYEEPIVDVVEYVISESITTNDTPDIGDIESEEWGVEDWED